MLVRSPYLDWITRFVPEARHNLASSGIAALSAGEMAQIEPRWSDDPIAALAAGLATRCRLRAAELLPCNGASQALWLAYAATLEAGDEALVERPAYAPFAAAPAVLGAHVRRFGRHAAARYALDVDDIRRRIGPGTRVVALSHLHNPTGVAAAPEAVAAIAEALAPRQGHVIVNEIYAPFADGTPAGPGLSSYRSLAPNIVCVGSLSKAFGLGPERIGWLAGPDDVIRRAAAAQLASTGDLAWSWAASARGALDQLPRLAARTRERIRGNRDYVARWLAQRSRLEWVAPEHAPFGLVRLPGGLDGRRLAEAAIARHGVIVVPGEFFDAPATFRLAWTLPAAKLAPALDALSDALSDFDLVSR